MPNKAYAILFDKDTENFYFPVKLDDHPNYGGMPQFFGGTVIAPDSDRETIARELIEESNNKLKIGDAPLNKIHTAQKNGTYNFYIASDFSGFDILGALKDNKEMKSIAHFYPRDVDDDDPVSDLLKKLNINHSQAFSESQTYAAFEEALRWGAEFIRKSDKEEID